VHANVPERLREHDGVSLEQWAHSESFAWGFHGIWRQISLTLPRGPRRVDGHRANRRFNAAFHRSGVFVEGWQAGFVPRNASQSPLSKSRKIQGSELSSAARGMSSG
jgi:hypothetical protein